jgi:GTP-sensing pleiotropic transcriptional regulator CodY
MNTEAPNFKGNYPLGGERIGPAWRVMWKMLNVRDWVSGVDLARTLADRVGLDSKTVANLLRRAADAGLLNRKPIRMKRPGGMRRVVHYRVALDKSDVQ